MPTTCETCGTKLLPNPAYAPGIAVYCPEHGDFIKQSQHGLPTVIVFVPFEGDSVSFDEIMDDGQTRKVFLPTAIKCNETGIVYASIRDAARAISTDPSHVSRQLNGHKTNIKGYTFSKVG